MTKPKVDHTNTICCICGSNKTCKRSDGNPFWTRFKNKKGRWDGKSYLCSMCYSSKPEGHNCAKKSLSIRRTGQLNIYDDKGKCLIGEAIIAKIRRLEILSIKTDNFCYKFDLSFDSEYGIIQVKIRTLKYGEWKVGNYINEDEFDNLFLICMSNDWEIVERVYIVIKGELNIRTGLAIVKNNSRGPGWYEKYRIDEKPYNDAYDSLIKYLNGRKYFGIEDIKKWLSLNEKN